ncbi:MAG: CAP domain-containing protein [Pseudomonadota bacterium]
MIGIGASFIGLLAAYTIEQHALLEGTERHQDPSQADVTMSPPSSISPTSISPTSISEEFQPVEGKITPPTIKGVPAPSSVSMPASANQKTNVPKPIDLVAGDTVPKRFEQGSEPSAGADGPSSAALSAEAAQQLAARQALEEVNAYRTAHDQPPLVLSDALGAVAKAHVVDLAKRGEVTSLNPAGAGVGVRLLEATYLPRVASSLVSGGYADFSAALEQWKADKVKRSRLLLPQATEMGFAVIDDRLSRYGTYIEVIIAAPDGDQ